MENSLAHEVDTSATNGSEYPVASHVQCCICGLLIEPNPSNMCPDCIVSHVNLCTDIQKEYILVYCPECQRYFQPPKFWGRADLESRELMSICLKRIKGLKGLRIVDALFLWTEPHSKRLKLQITLQKEVFANAVVEQKALIVYEVRWQQCPTCQKIATGQPQWDSVVQLRQRAEHKHTFLLLEQLILKRGMHTDVIRIDAQQDGLDFYFGHSSHAMMFVDFVGTQTPCTRKDSVQLISHDSKNNTAVQHHTFSIEIAPLCRYDLVVLPLAVYRKLGGSVGPQVLVHKVHADIVFLDPKTLHAGDITGLYYWKQPFRFFANTRQLKEFFVLEVQLTGVSNGKFKQAICTVCLSSEVGEGREWIVSTHLGAHLNPGDFCKGYLVSGINNNDTLMDCYNVNQFQEVVLVHKHYPSQSRKRHYRQWRLRQLDVNEPNVASSGGGRDNFRGGKAAGAALQALEQDRVAFLDDVERDPEYRENMQLYKKLPSQVSFSTTKDAIPQNDENLDDDEELPEIPLEELLDELTITDPALHEENDTLLENPSNRNELESGVEGNFYISQNESRASNNRKRDRME